MPLDNVKVEIRLTRSLVVHDVLEYEFNDLIQEFLDAEEAQVVGGAVWNLMWADGVCMFVYIYDHYPTTEIARDEVNGILHFKRVMFAMKEKFEKRIIRKTDELESGRLPKLINLIDQSEIPLYRDLAKELKEYSKYRKDEVRFQKNLKKIEDEVGRFNEKEYEFFRAGSKLGLTARQLADQLKEFKNKN